MQALATVVDEPAFAPLKPHLSTDYLNRYGEALMLIEMASMDPEIVSDLQGWVPVSYRAHFETSRLRCTPSALAAYDGLASDNRRAFDDLFSAMDRVIAATTSLLAEQSDCPGATAMVDAASESLRALIGQATQFINANGLIAVAAIESRSLQDDIDALFAS